MKEIEIFEDISDIEEKLNTDISSGLSRRVAKERAADADYVNGSFYVRRKRKFLSCFFGVVKMLPAAILTVVAIAAFFMGRAQLGVAVLSTFVSGSIISGMLYLSAQRESERMDLYSNPTVRVLREGKEYITDCRNLVVGDVIVLLRGDYIPADACVVESDSLEIARIYFDGGVKYVNESAPSEFDGSYRLIAGSFVRGGYGRAVVTAVGDDTVMSADVREGGLLKRNSDPVIIKRTYKYLTGFVSVLSVIALIMATVGMFTAKYVGILEIFLTYLALILSMTLISSPIPGRILLSSVLKRAAKNGTGGDYAVLKSNRAIDVLPNITDVAVIGLTGMTDGEKYPSGMFYLGREIDEFRPEDPNSFVFECVYAYIKARSREEYPLDLEKKLLDGLLGGLERVRFDSAAADVRIQSLYFGTSICDERVATVETASVSYRTYVGDNLALVSDAKYIRLEGGVAEITEDMRQMIYEHLDGAGSRGEIAYAVISEIEGRLILEGIIGLRDGLCESFCEIKGALARKGIATVVMLDEEIEYNLYYLRAAGFERKNIARADMDNISKSCEAYVGFAPEQYAELIAKMKENGKRIATIGIEDKYVRSYAESDVVVSYDNINYGSGKYRYSELETSVADGEIYSQRCSQRLRTVADVIIGRGTSESGGMRGFFEALKCAETFSYNYLQMILLYISFVASILLITVMTFVSGISLISYPVILLLVVALVFFTVAAFSTFKPRSFIEKKPIDIDEFTKSAAWCLIPPVVASLAYFALSLVLSASGYIMDVGGIPLATTFGIIITFILSFLGSMRTCLGKKIDVSDIKGLTKTEGGRGKLLNVAAMTLVLTSVVRMMLTAIVIPAMATEYGYVSVSIETFYLLGLYIAVYALCYFAVDLIRRLIRKSRK